jgi:hypothetical protein
MNLPLFEKSYLSVDVIFEYFTEWNSKNLIKDVMTKCEKTRHKLN